MIPLTIKEGPATVARNAATHHPLPLLPRRRRAIFMAVAHAASDTLKQSINRVIPSEARNLALFRDPSEIPRFARNDRTFSKQKAACGGGITGGGSGHRLDNAAGWLVGWL
jgi:hypothetical protein